MLKEKVLEGMGLTSSESRIYLILLEQGASLAGTISRNTGIHRRCVYDAIERLIQKGLVSYIKTNNRKYFEAVDPERLKEILHQQEEEIDQVLPELQILRQTSKDKKETLFFRGKAALRSAFDEQVDGNSEILVLGATTKANEKVPYYFSHYHNARVKKKLRMRVICNEAEKKGLVGQYVEIRTTAVKTAMSTYIYGNNTLIVAWTADPVAILIRQKEIADGYRDYFELIWASGKK
jgi:sugar-specific transcriptional regulator TrmB